MSMMYRRDMIRSLASLVAGSPLLAQSGKEPGLLDLINVHEFEDAAKRKMHKLAYDFIAGGAEDEQTLRANRRAFKRLFVLPRVMRDVTNIDTSVTVLGMKFDVPVIISPTGGKNLVIPNADETVAQAALATKTPICTSTGAQKILEEGKPLIWWSNTIGLPNKQQTQSYARRVEDSGGRGIVLTVDNPYQSNRDRNNRNKFDYGYMQTGVPKPGDPVPPPRTPAMPVMWKVHTPNLTWQCLDWLREASSMPVIVKGVLDPEDATLAVKYGASAISVSNHGARQLDGAIASLDALPDVAQAVGGKIPVLMDGGIRRGIDIVKAIALGADAVLVGRAPLWGLGAFGQPGVERVLWLLANEFKLAMGLAGVTNVSEIRKLKTRWIG
jgi:4-hydroxymandelate oxidase